MKQDSEMVTRGKVWITAAMLFLAILIALRLLPARLIETALKTGIGSSSGKFGTETMFLFMLTLLPLIVVVLAWFAPKALPILLSDEGLVPGNVFGGGPIKWADVICLDVNTTFMAPLLGAYCLDFTTRTLGGRLRHQRVYAYPAQDDIAALFENLTARISADKLTAKAIAMTEGLAEARAINRSRTNSAGVQIAIKQLFEFSFLEALRQMKYLYSQNLVDSPAAIIYAKLAFAQGDFITVRDICSALLQHEPSHADAARYLKLAEEELAKAGASVT